MTRITFRFSDGEQTTIDSTGDTTILEAAYAADLPLSKDCEVGDCQTCRATLTSGEIEVDEFAYITLDDDEIDAGEILMCVSRPCADVAVQLPYERVSLVRQRRLKVEIEGLSKLCESTVGLTLRPLAQTDFTFQPGQYVTISVPGSREARSFSMANAPGSDLLDFQIRLLSDGLMSNYLRNQAKPGDILTIEGPKGIFYLRDHPGPILMIAGGTGLAPMIAMLKHLVAAGEASRPAKLCFGVTGLKDLYFTEELIRLGELMPYLRSQTAIAQPEPAWTGHTGFVTDLIQPADITDDTQVYLCGPPPMISAARNKLHGLGLSPTAIFAEEFNPS
ncbi:MAG: FAD-binding oxidoreductase [Rhodospirillales bacterium]